MLTRVLYLIFALCSCLSAESIKPHVILVQLATGESNGLEMDVLKGEHWQQHQGRYLVSPGRSATQAALLFGLPPLQLGVVKDLDWRRQPVASNTTPSLAKRFEEKGYRSHFLGAWALGASAPFDPASRGFTQANAFEAAEKNTLTDPWGSAPPEFVLAKPSADMPSFIHLAEGRHLSRSKIEVLLKAWLEEHQHPTVIMVAEMPSMEEPDYHHQATWHCYTSQYAQEPEDIFTDWDLNHALRKMLGWKVAPAASAMIFHRGNWPVNESPEKHRHHGSLVLADGLALADGLSLYRANNHRPDTAHELDIATHQQAHQKLLTAHAQWWQKASRALNDPRAFTVGANDNQVTRLTALDWRSTKIIAADGSSPLSAPMVGQQHLLDVLEGLKTSAKYKETFPAYSGSWSVHIARPGRYKITASLLPVETQDPEQKKLMKLDGGTAHIRLGQNEVQLRLHPGATAVSVQTDAEAGTTQLESWFTGQLSLTRELGAFFVEIERVGDKKFDLKAKATEGK